MQANTSTPSSTRDGRLHRGLTHFLAVAGLVMAVMAQAFVAAPTPQEAGSFVLGDSGAPARSLFFSATGKTVRGEFLRTYERYGLERIGYPLTEERNESGKVVQYFERVRMESHPELAARGYSVLMTRLGADLAGSHFARVAPFKSTSAKSYFAETGHSLAEPFLSFWRGKGGVELFGYPISEPLTQDGLYVQWFERARFEYHPQLASQGKGVQLTHLGKVSLQRAGTAPAPAAPAPAQQKIAAPEAKLHEMEARLFNSINEQRAAAGLGAVQLDPAVVELSRARSSDMAGRNYFSHVSPDGQKFLDMLSARGIGYKYAGEILARNNYPAAEAGGTAFTSYLNSAPHKAVMMDGRYGSVGLGYALSEEDGMHYFTVIFVEK